MISHFVLFFGFFNLSSSFSGIPFPCSQGKDGQRCSVLCPCNYGLWCNSNNRCTNGGEEGESCDDDTPCAYGYKCNARDVCVVDYSVTTCTCGDGYEMFQNTCYKECKNGYEMLRPSEPETCYAECPDEFAEENDELCDRPSSYGRGSGRFSKSKCKANLKNGHTECEKNGLLWYPKCRENYYNFGCCLCKPQCPSGFTLKSVANRKYCKKHTYTRGTEDKICPPAAGRSVEADMIEGTPVVPVVGFLGVVALAVGTFVLTSKKNADFEEIVDDDGA